MILAALLGCAPSPDDPDGDPSEPSQTADTDTGSTLTETGTSVPTYFPPPTRLELACEPTANALRYACHVVVEPAQPVEVRFTRTDGLGPERTHPSALFATDHDVPLYFMAPSVAYNVTATATEWPGHLPATTTVTTGLPPPEVDSRLIVEGTSTMGLIGTELPCDIDAVAVVYDTATGELVWYQELDPDGQLGFMDMIRFTDDHTVLAETETAIVEVDLAGTELVRLERGDIYEERFHHDIFKWNGQYYLLYQVLDFSVILDSMLVMDAAGNVVTRWTASQHLDIPVGALGDWMHTNTVFVDASGDIYLSLRTQATIVKLEGDFTSPDFGDPIWILAGGWPAGLGSDIDVDWSGIPEPAAFEDQHNVHVRHDGRLMFLDNEHGRSLVLSVDEASKTATADAAYATSEPKCGPQGTAMETLAGNPVVGCFSGLLREYDLATGAQIWQAEPDCTQIGGFFGTGGTRWYPLDGW